MKTLSYGAAVSRRRTRQRLALCLLNVIALSAPAAPSLGLPVEIVTTHPAPDTFPLVHNQTAAPLILSATDWPGVQRAARDLQSDIARVTTRRPPLSSVSEIANLKSQIPATASVVLIGTLGRSPLIDRLVAAKKIDVSKIQGQWESFLIATISNPYPEIPSIEQALVIIGSDKRGAIYGIYELSEQIGVSPWYWWADVPVKHADALYIKLPADTHTGTHAVTQGPPAVKYRGIFINDEEPAFGPWAREKFGGINSRMYAHMFELILRLRGNYLWPAMWGKAFAEDDPESPRIADEYGIVMGTSHHEPMTRAHAEWTRHKTEYGNAEWNYATNPDALRRFFTEGAQRNKTFETITTIGMRGDGDEAMVKGGDIRANISLLERIVADQRQILATTHDTTPEKIPQLWALYKEVSEYYDAGMTVPDDVTLLWCDDNWGNNRRLPTPAERKRTGGAGIYYHFDYVGGPRNYKWINTNPLPKIWEQMTTAYEYGADRIWIVNVGDLKPMELPIEFFLRLAWNPRAITKETIAAFTERWATREFGPNFADHIADIVSKYAKYNAWRKPELLEPTTFSAANYDEANRVMNDWYNIVWPVEDIYKQLPPEYHDAFFQLVFYPVKASSTVNYLHIITGLNHLYATQGRAETNRAAQLVRDLFAEDQRLTDEYHQIAGSKWNHMMAQTRIGYTSWRDPEKNIMPALTELQIPDTAAMGVSVAGSEAAWPATAQTLTLPLFDSINRQTYHMEIFKRGTKNFDYTITTSEPWLKTKRVSASDSSDAILSVLIDWTTIPEGTHNATITILNKTTSESATIQLTATRSDKYNDTLKSTPFFGGLTGPTAIHAENASKKIDTAHARWEAIPDYGRGPSGMAIYPVTAPSVQPTPAASPRLEYTILIPQTGDIQIDLITAPTLQIQPGRGVRIAVSIDDAQPQILDAFAAQTFADPDARADQSAPPIVDWPNWVRDNSRTMTSTHAITTPGLHTLKIWMIDPGVILEKIILHTGKLPPSYFGPPPSK